MIINKKYRKTKLKWCSLIPEDWELKKLKYNTYIKARVGWHGLKSDEFFFEGEGAFCVTGTDFKRNIIEWETCYKVPYERYEEDPHIQLKNDDLLITKDGTIGKVALVKNLSANATLNSGVFVVRPKNNEYLNDFLYWVLQSYIMTEFINYTSKGSTIIHLYQDTFENMFIPLPSLKYQQKVVSYLDEKTSQIETIIYKKQKLIEHLKEERIAIINQAVTKGLNPNAEMKPSGIEWYQFLPKNWKIIKLKWISKIYSGGTPDRNKQEYWNEGNIPWLNSGTVNQFFITEPTEYISEEGFNNSSAKWIPINSIVIALAGQGKTKGMVALTTFTTTCNQSMGVIIPNPEIIHPRFLLYFLHINYYNLRGLSGEDKRDGLNLETVGNIKILLPSLSEQINIITYIEAQTKRIDITISKIEKEIELIKEYKTSLINEVVTGKLLLN